MNEIGFLYLLLHKQAGHFYCSIALSNGPIISTRNPIVSVYTADKNFCIVRVLFMYIMRKTSLLVLATSLANYFCPFLPLPRGKGKNGQT